MPSTHYSFFSRTLRSPRSLGELDAYVVVLQSMPNASWSPCLYVLRKVFPFAQYMNIQGKDNT